MKKTKIISIICALSMIFSMFTAVVNADNAKGIDLEASLSDDGTQITIEAFAKGTTGNLSNFMIAFAAPTGVTSPDSVVATDAAGTALTKNVNSEGIVKVSRLDMTGAGFAVPADKKIANIVITMPEGAKLTSDYTITLTGDAAIQELGDEAASKVSKGTMDATTVTVEKWKDPNAKSEKEERPDKQEETGGEVPEPVPVTSTKGIALENTISSDNKTITITAKAVGTTGNLSNFMIALGAVDGITSADQVTAVDADGVALTKNVNGEGVIKVSRLDMTGAGFAVPADKTIAVITLALADPLTEATAITFTGDSAIQELGDEAAAKVSKGTMTATSTVVTPNEADKGKATTVNLKDYMGKDKTTGDDAATVAEAAEDAGKIIYVTVDVTKENDEGDRVPATYGTDYEAEYNGETLTEAEYNNLIHGYTETPISEVIKGLKFNVYNTAKNAQIKTSLNSTTDDTQLVNDQEKTDVKGGGSSEQEPKDKTPVISVKSTATSVTAGDGTVVKVYVDNISNPNTDGSLYVSVNEGALDLVTGTGIKYIDEDLYDEDHDGEMQISSEDKLFEIDWPGSKEDKYIKFVGATKGTVKFTFHYVATGDVTGEPVVAKDVEKSITIKAASSSGGSSSSSKDNTSSGGGAIASGLVDSGSSYLPNLGFDDLGDVTWAQTAINTLAAKKIVSGVGENKFDPNAALTRAAYAQMLVNAIGHSTDSADTYFDDVPTDAWFYHNVAVASQLGIVSGFGDGTFRPNDLITREQMALMTQKAAVVMGKSLIGADNGTFTDDADIADWSRDAVYTLSDAGIINGMGDGTFGPQANATRAQAAVIIYNAFVK